MFNYSFDDPLAHSMVTPLMARIRDPASLVIFPPEGQCGATASGSADGLGEAPVPQEAGLSMVDVHLTEVMSHAALHIVLALEQQLRLCEESRARNILPEGLPMCTIFDEMEDSSATPRDGGQGASGALSKQSSAGRKPTPAPYKKKPSGRIHKWMGDVCMQVWGPWCGDVQLCQVTILTSKRVRCFLHVFCRCARPETPSSTTPRRSRSAGR